MAQGQPAPPQSASGFPDNALVQLQVARDAALQAARAAVRDTTRLTRLLAILSEPGTLDQLLDRALSTLSELFIADIIILLDPIGTGGFLPLASVGLPESMTLQPFSFAPDRYLYQMMREGKIRIIGNVAEDEILDFRFRELEAQVVVGLPVFGENSIRGVLVVARCQGGRFADSEIDLLATMAYRIGLTLEDDQRKVQLEEIIQSGNVIGRHLDPRIITSQAARFIQEITRAKSGAVALRNNRGEFYCAALHGLPMNGSQMVCSLASLLAQNPQFTIDLPYSTDAVEELLQCADTEILPSPPFQTMLAFPIHQNNHLVGILFAFRSQLLAFNAITSQMGMLYTNYVAAALENAHLFQTGQRELTERIKAEQALRASDNRFRAIIRSVSDIITILSSEGIIRYISPAAESLWKCSVVNLYGQNILDYLPDGDRTNLNELLQQVISQDAKNEIKGDIRSLNKEQQWRFFEVTLVNLSHDPEIMGIVATFHDVTERNLYEQELNRLAFHDPLTNLANRAHFMERLRNGLAQANRANLCVAVIFLDLDNFKQVNDTLGHEYGDKVLCTIADRVRSCLRQGDTAARLGGDEFTLLIEGLSSPEQVIPIVNRLLQLLHESIESDGHTILVGGSMGISLSKPYKDNPEQLLRKADLAMYQAKNSGKGCYRIYEVDLVTNADD